MHDLHESKTLPTCYDSKTVWMESPIGFANRMMRTEESEDAEVVDRVGKVIFRD
jgi:hypothetical protein